MKKFTLVKTLFGAMLLLVAMAFTRPAAEKKRVVFLGDSITQAGAEPGGYISLMRDALAAAGYSDNFELLGAGISGNKVPDLQKRLEADVLAKNPDLVYVYIGINDVWHWTHPCCKDKQGGTPKDKYEAGLKDIISRLKGKGAQIVICTPTVIGEKADGTNAQDKMLDEYAEISRKVARQNNLQLCDLRKSFLSYLKTANKNNAEQGILTSDQVHLNAAGNAFIALQMMPYLAKD
jgi:lysophospholipase L1-like esterase